MKNTLLTNEGAEKIFDILHKCCMLDYLPRDAYRPVNVASVVDREGVRFNTLYSKLAIPHYVFPNASLCGTGKTL